jgi:hypothetical protein
VDLDTVLAALFDLISPHLNERQRRLLLGAGARALGRGGGARMARISGMSRPTVYAGVRELEEPPDPHGRIRRPGGGPKRLRDTDPGLVEALDRLVDPDTRGDPDSPLRWTTKSTRELAEALTAQGHPVSDDTVGRLLKQQGYRLQRTVKTLEGAQHQDRDAQFRYLNEQAREHLAACQPVVSVDTKKKELVGNFANGGAKWQPSGEPVEVNVHDFPDPALGKAIPYGVLRRGAQRRLGERGHRSRHRRVCGGDAAALVGAGRPSRLPRGHAAAGHGRSRRVQRLPGAGVEDRAGPLRGRDGPCGDRVPLPARDQQVEQDRTSAVLRDLNELAGPATGEP